jgi:hypothetical protein
MAFRANGAEARRNFWTHLLEDLKTGPVPHNRILRYLPASRSILAKEPTAPKFIRVAIEFNVIVASWRESVPCSDQPLGVKYVSLARQMFRPVHDQPVSKPPDLAASSSVVGLGRLTLRERLLREEGKYAKQLFPLSLRAGCKHLKHGVGHGVFVR